MTDASASAGFVGTWKKEGQKESADLSGRYQI
jgi:hypothetical protein